MNSQKVGMRTATFPPVEVEPPNGGEGSLLEISVIFPIDGARVTRVSGTTLRPGRRADSRTKEAVSNPPLGVGR